MENASNVNHHCVPWISMNEWNQVYNDVYSDTIDCLKTAYERLLVWKARQSNLPSSVECTLGLLQVYIRDREISVQISNGEFPPYLENDLRLLYSTTIMRFLNLLTSMGQTKDETLFKIAKRMHIPEWLVILRHHSAHGSGLPSLSVLRLAANLAFSWAHEYYWKVVGMTNEDMILEKLLPIEEADQNAEDIKHLLAVWQSLKLQSSSNYASVDELSDPELRNYVEEIYSKRVVYNPVKKVGNFMEQSSTTSSGHLTPWSAAIVVLQELLETIRRRRTKNRNQELVDMIIETETFLPPSSTMHIYHGTGGGNERLPRKLFLLWRGLLSSLHKSLGILPQMIHRLVQLTCLESEGEHRRALAAGWVQQLSQGAVKIRLGLALVKQWELKDYMNVNAKQSTNSIKFPVFAVGKKKKKESKSQLKLKNSQISKVIKAQIEKKNPHLKGILPLKITHIPDHTCSVEFLEDTLLEPNSYTNLFLPSLIDLMIPPLTADAKQNLLSLVHIYSGESLLNDKCLTDDSIHSIEEILSKENQEVEMDIMDDSQEIVPIETELRWTKVVDEMEWSKTALGLLPWQRDKPPMLSLPENITWRHLVMPSSFSSIEDRNMTDLFHMQEIDWNTVIRKRPKKSERRWAKRMKLMKRTSDSVQRELND